MNEKLSRLWARLSSKAYRDAFVGSHLFNTIAAQIGTMREDRGWTQQDLADAADMKQSRIPVLEDPNNESLSITTLRRVASAFDVALVVRFVRFSELARWASERRADKFSTLSFEKDSVLEEVFAIPERTQAAGFAVWWRSTENPDQHKQPTRGRIPAGVLQAFSAQNTTPQGHQWKL